MVIVPGYCLRRLIIGNCLLRQPPAIILHRRFSFLAFLMVATMNTDCTKSKIWIRWPIESYCVCVHMSTASSFNIQHAASACTASCQVRCWFKHAGCRALNVAPDCIKVHTTGCLRLTDCCLRLARTTSHLRLLVYIRCFAWSQTLLFHKGVLILLQMIPSCFPVCISNTMFSWLYCWCNLCRHLCILRRSSAQHLLLLYISFALSVVHFEAFELIAGFSSSSKPSHHG